MDNQVLYNVQPIEVFTYFEELTRIPRGSGNEDMVAQYLVDFAKKNGFAVLRDEANNVLIRKNGTVGKETNLPLIMQAHMDIVCEKNKGVEHDFEKDPIQFEVEGDKIIAKQTTLGADNGIGVAVGMAILTDPTVEHPPIELVLTSDEERGMTGVELFDVSQLKGRRLINLDSDDEGVLVVGSAGGPVVRVTIPVEKVPSRNDAYVKLQINGLKGGHSGEDIHRGRANANKELVRMLKYMEKEIPYELCQISGGLKYNAIPREAEAIISLDSTQLDMVTEVVAYFNETLKAEYRMTDGKISVVSECISFDGLAYTENSKNRILDYIYFSDSGIQRMNFDFKNLVESSVSLGVIYGGDQSVIIEVMTRSSVESAYEEMYNKIVNLAKLSGGTTEVMSNCPEWEYDYQSKLKNICTDTYVDLFGNEPKLMVLHAGLECGVFGKKFSEKIDMISMGPDIRDLHTPGEYVTISSTQKFWKYMKAVLAQL